MLTDHFGLIWQAKLQATWLVLGTSFMVAFTNAAINKITKMMGVFERHLSVDQQEVMYFWGFHYDASCSIDG